MAWAMTNCMMFDEKDFEELYQKALLWVLENRLRESPISRIMKTYKDTKRTYPFLAAFPLITELKTVRLKTKSIAELKAIVSSLRANYLLNSDEYKNFMNTMCQIFPVSLKEKVGFIEIIWELCGESPPVYNRISRPDSPRFRGQPEVAEVNEGLQEDGEDGEEEGEENDDDSDEGNERPGPARRRMNNLLPSERRAALRREEEIEVKAISPIASAQIIDHTDGRHPIDWSKNQQDRFVSFFDIDTFFKMLPTKHGKDASLEEFATYVEGELNFKIIKDAEGNLVGAVFMTKDPRVIHRLDRSLSIYGADVLKDDVC